MTIDKLMLKKVPGDPGVYLFKTSKGDIVYVGKAKNLQKRVSSYFLKNKTSKTELLMNCVDSLDYIIVDNELEALLLENRLIKKHKPKFNVSLKNSQTYAYIRITDDKFPKIMTARIASEKGTYFGPYVGGQERQELIAMSTKLFKIRTCKTLPKKACLNFYIGTCSAPCIGKASKEEYAKQVQDAKTFLSGNTDTILSKLKSEMKQASNELKFEEALQKRRQIETIENYRYRQKVDLIRKFDQDVIGFVYLDKKVSLNLFSIKKGVILGKKDFSFSCELDLPDQIIEDFIKLYYSQNSIPDEIILVKNIWGIEDEKTLIETYLSRLKGSRVVITIPEKGEKRDLAKLAEKNILQRSESGILVELKIILNLPIIPSIIEAFDASNLGGDYLVGAMTRWQNASPDKSGYRKFKIKYHENHDDYAAIREIVKRRYERLINENREMPNLILIDGGLGHLNSALEALKSLGLQIPIISLAKREEEIYIPGTEAPLKFDKNSAIMLFLRKVRDSVHRQAITYNRKRREIKLREQANEISR